VARMECPQSPLPGDPRQPPRNMALRPYLATTGRVHTVITTRRRDLGYATVRLPVLSVEESVQLLNSGERQLGPSAELLAERLG